VDKFYKEIVDKYVDNLLTKSVKCYSVMNERHY